MIRKVSWPVRMALLLVVIIPMGAGIGWELAALSQRISGLAIGYISALIGSALCVLWAGLWWMGFIAEFSECMFGVPKLSFIDDFFEGMLGAAKLRIPPRPPSVESGQREEP